MLYVSGYTHDGRTPSHGVAYAPRTEKESKQSGGREAMKRYGWK
ncbi:MAG: hypothetical protein RLZZ234_507 [Candidatus Parcubacteria bacterium]|jgi:hypothetical protein